MTVVSGKVWGVESISIIQWEEKQFHRCFNTVCTPLSIYAQGCFLINFWKFLITGLVSYLLFSHHDFPRKGHAVFLWHCHNSPHPRRLRISRAVSFASDTGDVDTLGPFFRFSPFSLLTDSRDELRLHKLLKLHEFEQREKTNNGSYLLKENLIWNMFGAGVLLRSGKAQGQKESGGESSPCESWGTAKYWERCFGAHSGRNQLGVPWEWAPRLRKC